MYIFFLFFLKFFLKNRQSHHLSQFIWLIFTNSKEIHNYRLNVPYDCEFIIIQSDVGMTYTLTEIYQIDNSLFRLNFGHWEWNAPNFKDTFKYQRRLNLNNTVIALIVARVRQQQIFKYNIF